MRSILLTLLIFCLSLAALAQSTLGGLRGNVVDPSGLAVPGAHVQIQSMDEDYRRAVETAADGAFEIVNLKPGRYIVTATKPGFSRHVRQNVVVEARQITRADARLEIGETAQSVTVKADLPVTNSETPAISSALSGRDVLALPANTRTGATNSIYGLLAWLPGVQSDNDSSLSVQGGIPHQTEFSIDGISSTDVRRNGPLREAFPSAETVAEVRVQGVGNNAEFGQAGDITVISRRGSNQFHGALFEYLQNRVLDASTYGAPSKPQKTGNTFGATLGGPVWKNRTFFFATWESLRLRNGTPVINTVPGASLRSGVFNPTTVIRDPIANNTPFPGNRIPADRIAPAANVLLRYYPLPSAGTTDPLAFAGYRDNRRNPTSIEQYDIRIDQTLSNRHSVFARWTWKNLDRENPTRLSLPADSVRNQPRNLSISWSAVLKPSLLNEFRAGFNNSFQGTVFPFDGAKLMQELGLIGLGPHYPENGLPSIEFSAGTTNFTHQRPSNVHSETLQFNDNLSWTRGLHSLKFGFDIRSLRMTDIFVVNRGDDYGIHTFQGRFSGNDFADFLLGLPTFTNTTRSLEDDIDGRTVHYHVFAQDTWRLSRRLTLDFGLRWDYHPPFTEINGVMTNFDPNIARTGRVIIPSDPRSLAITSQAFLRSINACPNAPLNGVPCTPFVNASEAGWPERMRNADRNNFNPRLGFAWRPFGDARTVVRGGAGFYTMTVLGALFYSVAGVHVTEINTHNNSLVNGQPLFQWPRVREGAGTSGGAVGTQNYSTANNMNYKDPYSIQWNMTVERDLSHDTGIRVSYIAMRTINLTSAPDLNQPDYSTTAFTSRPLTDRPYPNWNIIFSRENGITATYHSLQTELHHRFRDGLTLHSTWTWAKNLADVSGTSFSTFFATDVGARFQDSRNRGADRGDVAHTRRHRWVTSAVYDLPFGKGHKFLTNSNRLADAVAGGWRLSTLFLIQTGPYLTALMTGGDPSGTNGNARGSQRPDAAGINPNLSDPTPLLWWNRNAFMCPGRPPGTAQAFDCNVAPIGRFGNAGPSTLLGPGTINLNAALAKRFALTERVGLRVEGSFTNLPNHPNFDNPGTGINSVAFGRTASVRGADSGGNRVGQLALRIEF